MNSLVGKSTGIALLMAAALLAALFAMGVFSANGVGAQEADPATATAALTDEDTVTITVTGIDKRIAAVTGTELRINMPEDLGALRGGTDGDNVAVSWGGSDQAASTLTNPSDYTDDPGQYLFTFLVGSSIDTGSATITITLGENSRVDDNTTINALEIGGATEATSVTVDVGVGLAISGAPAGPSLTLSPMSTLVVPGADGETPNIVVTVTGSDYPATTVDLAEVSDDGDGNEITTGAPQLTPTNITVADIVDGEFTSELTINGESLGSPYTVTVTSTQAGDIITATFTVAAAPEPAPYTLSTDVATEGVRIQLSGTATTPVPAGEDLTVTLKKWGLPSSIPTSSVLILGTTSNMSEPYSGEPAEVRIEAGNKILLSLTSRYENGEAAGPLLAGQDYSVVFKKSAGITNPILAGDKYAMQLADLDPGSHSYGSIQIKSKVKLVPATNAGPRGTALEITGLGLNSGDATIFLNSETRSGRVVATAYRLDKAYASGGIAKVTVDTTTQNFIPGTRVKTSDDTKLEGLNQIYIIDASGKEITTGNTAQFEITPLMELDGDVFKRGGKVNITVSDWVYGNLHTIQIGGVTVTEVPDGSDTELWTSKYGSRTDASEGLQLGIDEVEFEFIVPNNARLGEQELKLISHSDMHQGTIGDDDFAKSKILIGAFDLTLEPATAVTDQVIKIEGSGFGRDACITSILVGDQRIAESTSGNRAGSWAIINGVASTTDRTCGPENDRVEADSNGGLADTFQVPDKLKPNTYRVIIRDINDRIGIADLTVPEPEIELEPPASQRGSNVVVIGSNFPAEDVITIDYRGRTVTAANTDTVGRFRATFPVPVNAPIGEEHEIIATSADKADGSEDQEPTLKAKALHRVPDEVLEVTPETAAPGTRITVSARNLPLYTTVGVSIGGVGVLGSSVGELSESDGNGEWEGTPLVPQLTPGTHTVEMTVGKGSTGIRVSTFLEIADIITRASDEAFADLIDNGTLTRVWYLEAATQTWSFFDPAPEFADFNTLTEVSTGQIVTIIMATQDEFQGRSLYVGSNNVAIE